MYKFHGSNEITSALRFSFQDDFRVESALLVRPVSDDTSGTVRFVKGVFTLNGVPFASLKLVLFVSRFRISYAVFELVPRGSLKSP